MAQDMQELGRSGGRRKKIQAIERRLRDLDPPASPEEERLIFAAMRGENMGAFVQFWHCDIPEEGESYQVLRENWDHEGRDVPIRHIYEIKRA